MAYWLQLKGVFEHYRIDFPVLLPRCFGLYIPTNTGRKIQKNSFQTKELFEEESTLRNKVLNKIGEDYSLDEALSNFEKLWEVAKEKATSIDPTLEEHALAEKTRIEKRFHHLEGKIRKAVEKKHDDALNQISAIKDVE